jgi:phenylpropionate dioxygenase-like ring-hydroxylating dioxygenase large terminal subunit
MTSVVGTELTDDAPVGATITTGIPVRLPVSVPAYRYTSPEFAALERERLWPRVWQLACSADHVANVGDWFEHTVGPYSVLIVRGDDGELRAFQNVCLHRGNELCHGSGSGLSEIRCGYHRWCWDLAGRLREVPSRRGFGTLRNDDYGLMRVHVDTWGPLVFVNSAAEAEPLAEFLEGIPADIEWVGLDDFRCRYLVSIGVPCNWKTLIDGFSETYHVQGIHREMLPSVDDVNGPQYLWTRHGKLTQPYGVPSPRIRNRPDNQAVWESFVTIMGGRAGVPNLEARPAAPDVPDGSSLRSELARLVRESAAAKGVDFSAFSDEQIMTMQQYNLFPNVTAVVFPDVLSVIRSRPGETPDEAIMDAFVFERHPAGDSSSRVKPLDLTVSADDPLPIGLVLTQDVGNLKYAQRGLHQPGFTRLTLSGEECRIVNLHRNLERWLDIKPSEIENDV